MFEVGGTTSRCSASAAARSSRPSPGARTAAGRWPTGSSAGQGGVPAARPTCSSWRRAIRGPSTCGRLHAIPSVSSATSSLVTMRRRDKPRRRRRPHRSARRAHRAARRADERRAGGAGARHGGEPVSAPALREVSDSDGDAASRASSIDCRAGAGSVVILLTGAGVSALVREADALGRAAGLIDGLERATYLPRPETRPARSRSCR